MSHATRTLLLASLLAIFVTACQKQSEPTSEAVATTEPAAEAIAESGDSVSAMAETVTDVADRYYSELLSRYPQIAYFSGVEIDRHDGIEDRSPAARLEAESVIDNLLDDLESVDSNALAGRPEWLTLAYIEQSLKSSRDLRVCRFEWWNVNQMDGWQTGYALIAELQPVGSPELREQSLARWGKFSAYVDQEIENARQGLAQGYSSPRSVVRLVLDQVDGLLALDIEDSPYYSPAVRDPDPDFVEATRTLVAESVYPALQRYRDFLADEYLDQAREALAVTANPDGEACYEASLRSYTTLDRSGRDVFELGQKTVEANKATVIELGKEAYGLDDFDAIIAHVKADPDDYFESKEQLLQFSRDAVERAHAEMPNWIGTMPRQPVEVIPFPEHEEGTGRSAHYRPPTPDRPGEYRIPLHEPEKQTLGAAESTAFHETWPGHHLQVAVAQSVEDLHPVSQILWFAGPGEGWARYSEGLAEEMDLYETVTGPIQRRAWPARGMVVDPGIHLLGWTREEAVEFMIAANRFPESTAVEQVDRIAILPGQLTAYDSGGLEILALRREAEEALGDRFDIREFHDQILAPGAIPLVALRQHIERWIARRSEQAQ
ncbi:DUF885 domain-containing protein [Elongatibacter sediminis]|uniref:DUF885 family protein n=1 Tax=Elongatibacter sediminis TaxID=3119006 RepID=A0AAW9R548_9GAMM